MRQSVLVTGAAGFLGSVMVGKLLEKGYRVTALDRVQKNASLLFYCSNPNFDYVVGGDVRDESLMKELLSRHDVIFPLAAIVGAKACSKDPEDAQTVNYNSIVLLNQLKNETHKIVWPCTNSGYGAKSSVAHSTEETPMEPTTLYGSTKVDAEKELLKGGNAISLRLATVFGASPKMRFDLLVHDWVFKAVTEGELVIFEKDFIRNFVHIQDVADCFCYCIENFNAMKGEAYNLGLEENLSKEQLALKIKKYVPGLKLRFEEVGNDPDKRNTLISVEKLKQKGFEAKRSLDIGIPELIKTYKVLGNQK